MDFNNIRHAPLHVIDSVANEQQQQQKDWVFIGDLTNRMFMFG
jgi:hypothetical protein